MAASARPNARRGDTHFDPALGQVVPFNVSDMDDFWFSNFAVTGAGLNFSMAPLFYVVDSSRYYDPSQPNNNGRIVDLWYDQEGSIEQYFSGSTSGSL